MTLKVRHEVFPSSQASGISHSHQDSNLPHGCPASISRISFAVCSTLAGAVPKLQKLCLEGCCKDAAFNTFASLCPQLTHVQVEAVTVPISTLQRLNASSLYLRCLELTAPSVATSNSALVGYVDASLHALRTSTSLATLILNFHSQVAPFNFSQQGCQFSGPQSLVELVSHGPIYNFTSAPKLLLGLRTLSLTTITGCTDVFNILRLAPQLQLLTILGASGISVDCEKPNILSDISYLKGRLIQGLNCAAPFLQLFGFQQEVHHVLASMPALLEVQCCRLTTYHSPVWTMMWVPRIFPNLTEFHLNCTSPPKIIHSSISIERLAPLAGCVFMRVLKVHVHLSLTTVKVVQVLQWMPRLTILGFMKTFSVNRKKVEAAMLAISRRVEIQEYSSIDDVF